MMERSRRLSLTREEYSAAERYSVNEPAEGSSGDSELK